MGTQFRSPCIKPTEKTFGNNSSSLSHVVGSAGIPKDVFDSKCDGTSWSVEIKGGQVERIQCASLAMKYVVEKPWMEW